MTVKSFSSTAGVRRPGFQLLSLVPPDPSSPYVNQVTHADRPCSLPDQGGVYSRVYLPLAILTLVYLVGSNFWTAWERWNASGHSIYGDFKSRLSPNLQSSEKLPPSAGVRRTSDRPSPLALPTRRSSQQLAGITGISGISAVTARLAATPRRSFSLSAPVSPTSSPAPSPRSLHRDSAPARDYDEESQFDHGAMARSISYGTTFPAESYCTPALGGPTDEPGSYFLPLPESSTHRSSIGLGLSTPSLNGLAPSPHTQTLRRSSSASFAHTPLSGLSGLSRMSDISAAAKAKDKSVLGYMVDSIPIGGSPRKGIKGGYGAVRGFLRATMRPRHGLVGKSIKEMVAVAWPTALVWLAINCMFFLG